QHGGEFLGIGTAILAADLILADRNEAQRLAGRVARRVPAALGAEIAVLDIELVGDLAGPGVDHAAQQVEIGILDAEKRLRMLQPRAGQRHEAATLLLCSDHRVGRLSRRQDARQVAAAEERDRPDQAEQRPGPVHRAGPITASLSSPSAGAGLSKGGRTPSKDSGRPTSARSLCGQCWMMPSAWVWASATTW